MKIHALLSFGSFLLATGINAQFFSDSFSTGADPSAGEYVVGSSNLAGQNPTVSGWSGAWQAATGNGTVLSNGLQYSGLVTSGGAIVTQSNARFGRSLSQGFDNSTAGTFYFSVLLRVEDNISNYRSLEIHNNSIDDGNRALQIAVGEAGTSNYTFTVLNDPAMRADLGAGDNSTNLFVVKMDFSDAATSDSVSIWRNPENLLSEAGSTTEATFSGFDLGFNITSLARFGSGGGIIMDEFRVGSSWSDVVVAVPEPSTYAMVLGLMAAFIVFRRKSR